MRNKTIRIIFSVALAICMLVLAVYHIVNSSIADKQRRKNIAITQGVITAHGMSGDGVAGYFHYVYHVKKQYKGTSSSSNSLHKNASLFIGKVFPVGYDSLNPKSSIILITPLDFEEYGIPFPDSLDWVREYMRR